MDTEAHNVSETVISLTDDTRSLGKATISSVHLQRPRLDTPHSNMSLSTNSSARYRPSHLPLLPSVTRHLPIPPMPLSTSSSSNQPNVVFEGTHAVYISPTRATDSSQYLATRCMSAEELALVTRFNMVTLQHEDVQEGPSGWARVDRRRSSSGTATPGTESGDSAGGIFWADGIGCRKEGAVAPIRKRTRRAPSEQECEDGEITRTLVRDESRRIRRASVAHGRSGQVSQVQTASPPLNRLQERGSQPPDIRAVAEVKTASLADLGAPTPSRRSVSKDQAMDLSWLQPLPAPPKTVVTTPTPDLSAFPPPVRPPFLQTRSFSSYRAHQPSHSPTAEPAMAMIWPSPVALANYFPAPAPANPVKVKGKNKELDGDKGFKGESRKKEKKGKRVRPASIHTSPAWSWAIKDNLATKSPERGPSDGGTSKADEHGQCEAAAQLREGDP